MMKKEKDYVHGTKLIENFVGSLDKSEALTDGISSTSYNVGILADYYRDIKLIKIEYRKKNGCR